ncbi:hypothetical protein ACP70R_000045 [Stipagrostis hirtigluma subsp. patula]
MAQVARSTTRLARSMVALSMPLAGVSDVLGSSTLGMAADHRAMMIGRRARWNKGVY